MDSYSIGQRIRKFRKARNLSQEKLAELVDISTTHMSHIETGGTKLSLPVLADIAAVLKVSTDEILFGHAACEDQNHTALSSIERVISTCSPSQARVIAEIVVAAKSAMDESME